MTDEHKRGQDYRRSGLDRLLVHIVNSDENLNLVGTTVSCSKDDVSVNGLKASADKFILQCCELNFGWTFARGQRRFS